MIVEDLANRKAQVRGLRRSVECVANQEWATDRTKSLLYGLLAVIGRTGDPVPDGLVKGRDS